MEKKYFYIICTLSIFLFFLTGCNDNSKTTNNTNDVVEANRLSSDVTIQNNNINTRK